MQRLKKFICKTSIEQWFHGGNGGFIMYWIDMDNNAHYVSDIKDISNKDFNNSLSKIIFEDGLTDISGNGNKRFIVSGIGKVDPAIQELISADSMKECVEYVNRKYAYRIAIGTLLCIQYYRVVE